MCTIGVPNWKEIDPPIVVFSRLKIILKWCEEKKSDNFQEQISCYLLTWYVCKIIYII